jgi:hypothetical protein
MLDEQEWRVLIARASAARPVATRALEYRNEPILDSFASPPLVGCEDGEEYWVKFVLAEQGCIPAARTPHLGGMITDHVVGLLAQRLAPQCVPPNRLVLIGDDLIAIERRLSKACPGLAHGSRNASKNTTNRMDFAHGDYYKLPINRPRMASLAVLYGFALASDHQVIFQVGGESLVFSVDHGHFFPGGPAWTAAGLAGAAPAVVDPLIVTKCQLTRHEIEEAIKSLEVLVATDIAEAVAAPPDDWFFPESDRIALADYLWNRREVMLQARI